MVLARATSNFPNFQVNTHALYVYDTNFVTEDLPPGARVREGVVVKVEVEVERDLEV